MADQPTESREGTMGTPPHHVPRAFMVAVFLRTRLTPEEGVKLWECYKYEQGIIDKHAAATAAAKQKEQEDGTAST